MSRYNCSEKEILSLMNFTGLSRQEAVEYLHDLIEMENAMRYREEQESKALEKLFSDRFK